MTFSKKKMKSTSMKFIFHKKLKLLRQILKRLTYKRTKTVKIKFLGQMTHMSYH